MITNFKRFGERQTGRTTRILELAVQDALNGREVFFYLGNQKLDYIFNLAPIAVMRDLGVASLGANRTALFFKTGGSIRFRGWESQPYDERGVTNGSFIYDHYALEQWQRDIDDRKEALAREDLELSIRLFGIRNCLTPTTPTA